MACFGAWQMLGPSLTKVCLRCEDMGHPCESNGLRGHGAFVSALACRVRVIL